MYALYSPSTENIHHSYLNFEFNMSLVEMVEVMRYSSNDRYPSTRNEGPRGFRQKNLQNWDSMNRRRRMKIMVAYFTYTVLVIDYCGWKMVKISRACRALTISP